MQETLSQLSDLNNDAIAESSRTAAKLTDDDWVGVEHTPDVEAARSPAEVPPAVYSPT